VVVASITIVRVILGRAVDVKVMVLPAARLKIIMCGVLTSEFASVIACLREPEPLSAEFVTVKTVAFRK
jgi:hypothetical protein